MSWSRTERRGVLGVALGTLVMIALTIAYLWYGAGNSAQVDSWDFIKISVVIALVWAAIGITMGIFIVMVLRKNAGRS